MVNLAILCGFNKDLYPEIYISGPQRETSKIPYQISVNYLHKSPNIQPLFSVYNSLHIKAASGGIIKHLPFEKATLEGKNPSVVLLTEYHLHTTDTMQESARSSVNLSRKNQLIIYDTTKGHDTNSVCYKREQNYKDLLYQQILNPEKVYIVYDVFL
jgi:phage terminase large subunit-like protein